MRDKIEGVLYGMALGDAMGMPSELWGRKRIKNYFKNKIEEFLDGPSENDVACNYKKGQVTDDTGQALVLLESIVATDYLPNSKDIAGRLLEWADRENAFENNILGPTSKVALANYRDEKVDLRITDKALSNGSAMRIAPIGCLFTPDRKKEIVDYVYEVSKVTHSSDVTIAGAAMIAVGVSSAIVNTDFENVMKDIIEIEEMAYEKGCETFSAKLSERIKIALQIAKDCKNNDELFLQKIYDIVGAGVGIIESVPAAIGIAYYAQNPNESCLLSANLGGDTDTIGAMATALCGAFVGINQFKPDYIHTLRVQNNIDFDKYIEILMNGRDKLR